MTWINTGSHASAAYSSNQTQYNPAMIHRLSQPAD